MSPACRRGLCVIYIALCTLGAGVVAGCDGPEAVVQTPARAQRIVSLDYCSDQYLLQFIDRSRILALSPDAASTFSYKRDAAKGIPVVSPRAEDVIRLQPDLVLRSYGGGPNATNFFKRAGIPVVNVGWSTDLEGMLNVVESTAAGLNEAAAGKTLVQHTRDRLAKLKLSTPERNALYMTPLGVTSGEGSLIHDMLVAAGFSNYVTRPGWQPIPLEKLVYTAPHVVATAFYGDETTHRDSWSPSNHPVAKHTLRDTPVVPLSGAWTACGGWFLVDAIEALAQQANGQ